MPEPIITDGARKHGITEDDTLHARPNQLPEVNTMARTLKEILAHADDLAAQLEGDPTIMRVVPRAEQELRLAAIARAQAERRVTETVTSARREGVSWARIGKALGTTAQSAQHRYRDLVPAGADASKPRKPARSRRRAAKS